MQNQVININIGDIICDVLKAPLTEELKNDLVQVENSITNLIKEKKIITLDELFKELEKA